VLIGVGNNGIVEEPAIALSDAGALPFRLLEERCEGILIGS